MKTKEVVFQEFKEKEKQISFLSYLINKQDDNHKRRHLIARRFYIIDEALKLYIELLESNDHAK